MPRAALESPQKKDIGKENKGTKDLLGARRKEDWNRSGWRECRGAVRFGAQRPLATCIWGRRGSSLERT